MAPPNLTQPRHRARTDGPRLPDERVKAVAVLLLAAIAVALAGACAGTPRADATGPWARLPYKTGWIMLGYLNEGAETWATQPILRRTDASGEAPPLPHPGDMVEIAKDALIIVVDFTKRGDANRLTSPAGRTLYEDDSTGNTIPPGTHVRVADVQRGKALNGIQEAWARVEAADAPRP